MMEKFALLNSVKANKTNQVDTAATTTQGAIAQFPKQPKSNLHPPVELPPEPLTSPREARPGKSNDGPTPGNVASKYCTATAEKENASPTGVVQNHKLNGEMRQNSKMDKGGKSDKLGLTERPPGTLTSTPVTNAKGKNLYASYTTQVMGGRTPETQRELTETELELQIYRESQKRREVTESIQGTPTGSTSIHQWTANSTDDTPHTPWSGGPSSGEGLMSKDLHGSTKLGYGEGDRVTPFPTGVGIVPRYEHSDLYQAKHSEPYQVDD
jgi:hypothetical protein